MSDRADFKLLGRVFLSHASTDKPFVRRLANRLGKAGVDVWLDERELIVGDSLPREISAAVHAARAVIIVISAASLESNWLRHELRIAAERMIMGECRLIPVLLNDVEVPPEITGLLYADFRPNKRGGTAKILKALAEQSRLLRGIQATMESDSSLVRWRGLDLAISDVFDGKGWATMMFSATHEIDFSVVSVTTPSEREEDVVLETLADHLNRSEAVTVHDWDEWKLQVNEELGQRFGLLVSERPPSSGLTQHLSQKSDGVWIERLPASIFEPGGAMVMVVLAPPTTDQEAQVRLETARLLLVEEVTFQVPPMIDPRELRHLKEQHEE